MDGNRIQSIVATTWSQILASAENKYVVWSWGVSKRMYTEFNGMATLMLRVSGVYHKGWVYIALNEGKDLYEIHLMNTHFQPKKGFEPITDVYNDDLADIIDRIVERGTTSLEEYGKKAMADSKKKLSA